MKIDSIDRKSWVEVTFEELDGYSSFIFSANIDIGHGQFSGKNIDVQFLNISSFIAELDSFILNRRKRPILEGTYGSYISFEASKINSVMLKFCIGDAYSGYSGNAEYGLNGAFEIDQGQLESLLSNFRVLESNA